MDKWEYKVVSTGAGAELEKLLNELGEKGWELVGFIPIQIGCKPVFKRKLLPQITEGLHRQT